MGLVGFGVRSVYARARAGTAPTHTLLTHQADSSTPHRATMVRRQHLGCCTAVASYTQVHRMRPPSPISFGAQVRQYRERAGLTQEALAERAGLTVNAISALERGTRRQPYLHTVTALATALALSAQEHAGLLAARTQPRDALITEPDSSTPTPPPALPSAHSAVAAPANPLMLTKLRRPQVTVSVVERPRLHEAFRAGIAMSFTLVAAPAGYGKTTLVAGQLAALPQPSAWLSLDAGDNDPATFVRYLVATVQSGTGSVSAPTRSLVQAATPRLESVLLSLSNDLAALP